MSDTIHEVKYDVATKLKVINLKQLSLLPEKVFNFGDYKITMSPEKVRFSMLRICFMQIAGTLRDEFEDIYRSEYTDIQVIKDNTLDQVAMFINSVLEGTYDLLVSQGMEGMDFDTYVKTYYASHFDFYSYYKAAALDKDGFGQKYDMDETRVKIVGGLYKNVYKVIYAYCGAIGDVFHIKAQDTSDECKEKADKLFQELLQLEKGKESIIAEILNNDPYKKEAYEYAIMNGLDVNCELGEIAKLASVDITDTVMVYIKRFYGTLDKSDRVALASARALFQGTLNKYHIPTSSCHVLSEIDIMIDSLTSSESDSLNEYYEMVKEPFFLYAEKLHRINDGFHKGIYYVGEGKDGTGALKEYVTTVLSIPDISNNVPVIAWKERDSAQMSFFFTEKEVCFSHPMNGCNVIDSEPIKVPISEIKDFGAKHRPKKQSQLVAMLNNGENVEPGFEFDKIDTSYFLGIFQLGMNIVRELSIYLGTADGDEETLEEASQIETLSTEPAVIEKLVPEQTQTPEATLTGIELFKSITAANESKKAAAQEAEQKEAEQKKAEQKKAEQKIAEQKTAETKDEVPKDAEPSQAEAQAPSTQDEKTPDLAEDKGKEVDTQSADVQEKQPEKKDEAVTEAPPIELSYAQLSRIEELCMSFAEKNSNTYVVTPKMISKFKIPESEKVYTGYDSSILANGKSGFVITDRGIYCKMPLKKIIFTSWGEFARCSAVRFKNDFEGVVYVGDIPAAYVMTMNNGPEKNSLFELFTVILNSLRTNEATA